ncbi:MAG: ribonuclease Z [Candidatus Nanoarchaeia archaeon]|nr:ribonuclease Z [Candidatus Nanoarchaeia archaeon]
MQLTVLGSSSAIPTKERNHSAFLLEYEGNTLLFDCGEGTQRQMVIAGIPVPKIDKIFISHWHGDHVLGLAGIIQTCTMSNRVKELEIYGPKGSKERFEHLKKAFSMDINYPIKVIEVSNGTIFENKDYEISVFPIGHGAVPSRSYSFKQKDKLKINLNYVKKFGLVKHRILGELQRGHDIVFEGDKIKAKDATIKVEGKKIVYIGDGRVDSKMKTFAKDADLIISEATYTEEHKSDAVKNNHMTAKEISEFAHKSNAKMLLLTHFSRKLQTLKEVSDEAKSVFKGELILAKDFMKIKL